MFMVVVFPAPFGPEEAHDLARRDGEGDVARGLVLAVHLRQSLDLDHESNLLGSAPRAAVPFIP